MLLGDDYLSYCMNAHPIERLEDLHSALTDHARPLKRRLVPDGLFGLGLWLSGPCVEELESDPEALPALIERLEREDFRAFTVNAFPIGGFHDERVKEKVYRPSWASPERLSYTKAAARVLARLLAEDQRYGSISTVPLSFKAFGEPLGSFIEPCLTVARFLSDLEESSGKQIRLCFEPEPHCVLETTADVVNFFDRLREAANSEQREQIDRYLGVCFDTCHVALQWEDLAASVAVYEASGIAIGKAQISVALELRHPASNERGLARLKTFDEPRYLHQCIADSGLRAVDLPDLFEGSELRAEWHEVSALRTHFHVPVFWAGDNELTTTRGELDGLVPKLSEAGCRHFEVETYSWTVIPAETRSQLFDDVNDMLEAELRDLLGRFPGGASLS